ncbi:Nif3-like dinuclear metal center hexameric protein [Candidatus Dojkabacteria bacterium]|nr:Nif3-like dinuclear metal center hexameric protein [Candidatus Dojkabacteria bacterium]
MVTLSQLNRFLTKLMHYDPKMDVSKIDERNANGLQVNGNEDIEKIVFGVTASEEFFKLAKKSNCEAVVVHHGIRMPDSPHYQKFFQRRYGYLIRNDISLFGYHFLLDSHPEIGHNALILKYLGIRTKKELSAQGANWGWYGKSKKVESLVMIASKCEKLFKRKPTVYDFGESKIKTVGAISGGGSLYGRDLQNLLDKEIDLYITGEVTEGVRELAREAEINIIAGGHYATERVGVLALMDKVKREFKGKVKTEFIELWNEV